MTYRDTKCPNCGRLRVEADGICEKCEWDVDGGDYARVTRSEEYVDGHRLSPEARAKVAEADAAWARVFGTQEQRDD